MNEQSQPAVHTEDAASQVNRAAVDLPPAGQLMSCRIDQLQPHPAFERHGLSPSSEEISRLIALGDRAFENPILITHDFYIVAGFAQWRLAVRNGRTMLPCLQHSMTEEEAILAMLKGFERRTGANDYIRVLIALDLEPSLKEAAFANMQLGGQMKGSSKLTKAERVDVRKQIAVAAGVCVANVSKVKQLQSVAAPEVLKALFSQEVSIHRAWEWRRMPEKEQRAALHKLRTDRGLRRDVTYLVNKHRSRSSQIGKGLSCLGKAIAILGSEDGLSELTSLLHVWRLRLEPERVTENSAYAA